MRNARIGLSTQPTTSVLHIFFIAKEFSSSILLRAVYINIEPKLSHHHTPATKGTFLGSLFPTLSFPKNFDPMFSRAIFNHQQILTTMSKHDKAWNIRFKQLVEYKEQFGNCCVPLRFKSNPSLGRWVNRQREARNKQILCWEREKQLNDIGKYFKTLRTSNSR